jgi:hypothetical protein
MFTKSSLEKIVEEKLLLFQLNQKCQITRTSLFVVVIACHTSSNRVKNTSKLKCVATLGEYTLRKLNLFPTRE